MHPAGFIVDKVGGNDQGNSRNQQPGFVINKKLFQHQKNKTTKEKGKGQQAVVVFFITMIKGIGTNAKSKQDHPDLKSGIVNNVYTKQGQAAEKQRKQGTVYGTGQRGPDP